MTETNSTIPSTNSFEWAFTNSKWIEIILKSGFVLLVVSLPGLKGLVKSYRKYTTCKRDPDYKTIMFIHYIYFLVNILNIVFQLVINVQFLLAIMMFLG